MSISPWAHYESVSAVEWGAGAESLWLQNHVNRMDECGISGGTPMESSGSISANGPVAGSVVPPCKAHVKLDVPLVLVTGSGSFYNFCAISF